MKCPFKVGDKVRVISKEQALKYKYISPHFVENMLEHCSKIVTICAISEPLLKTSHYNFSIQILEDNEDFIWSECFFINKYKLSLE